MLDLCWLSMSIFLKFLIRARLGTQLMYPMAIFPYKLYRLGSRFEQTLKIFLFQMLTWDCSSFKYSSKTYRSVLGKADCHRTLIQNSFKKKLENLYWAERFELKPQKICINI